MVPGARCCVDSLEDAKPWNWSSLNSSPKSEIPRITSQGTSLRLHASTRARRLHLSDLGLAMHLAHFDQLGRIAEKLLSAGDGSWAYRDRAGHVHAELFDG